MAAPTFDPTASSSTGIRRPAEAEAEGDEDRHAPYIRLPDARGEVRERDDSTPDTIFETQPSRRRHLIAYVIETLSKRIEDPTTAGKYQMKDGNSIDITVNEDPEEIRLRLREPVILQPHEEFSNEDLAKGMKAEMNAMETFDVFEEVPISQLQDEEIRTALDMTWVHRWKGFVRSRLCVRGFRQEIQDIDDTYASTPLIWTLYILITFSLSKGYSILLCDISTAFLHAKASDTSILVWPPKEFYPNGDTIWRLRKAMYGLRTSPKDWQIHFAQEMQRLGFVRLQSDPNVYVNSNIEVFILCYVDDCMIFGSKDAVQKVFDELNLSFIIRVESRLDGEGEEVTLLGRTLRRQGDSITFKMKDSYLDFDMDYWNVNGNSKAVLTTGTSTMKNGGDEAASNEDSKQIRHSLLIDIFNIGSISTLISTHCPQL